MKWHLAPSTTHQSLLKLMWMETWGVLCVIFNPHYFFVVM